MQRTTATATATTTTTKNKKKNHPIPDDLIREILLKLQIKPLIRFTTVSKSWRTLITNNPKFAKTHFDLTTPHPTKILHVDFHFNFTTVHSIDPDESLHHHDDSSSHHRKLAFPLHTFSHVVPIRSSCRGILLLDGFTKIFLWNPITGSLKRLNYPPQASKVSSVSIGFGYDELHDDYLVVVASNNFAAAAVPACHFEVYSTRDRAWSEIEGGKFYYLRVGDQSGWFLNGCVHWLVQDGGRVHVILAFDLTERRLTEISPPPRQFVYWNSCKLRVLGGCLSVCFSNQRDEVEIWVMREYRVSSSWTRQVVVGGYQFPSYHLSPVCINAAGEVIAKDDRVGLVKLDRRGQMVEIRAYCSKSTTSLYMETLLSPPGVDEASEDDRR